MSLPPCDLKIRHAQKLNFRCRMRHPADPPLAHYPLTTHLTPLLLDLCRACNKAPAVYTVLGDTRLGESPLVLCAPCWGWMGKPTGADAEGVTVLPLPKYERGWVRPLP